MTQRLLILVEGPTEQAFVSRLLAPCLCTKAGIVTSAPCIETSRDKSRGLSFRGGHAGRYDLIRRHVLRLLSSDPAAYVSSMFDLYGLPEDFPGMTGCNSGDCFDRACHLEQSFADDIGNRRFLPNLIIHEFEGLLFTSPDTIAAALMRLDLTDSLRAISESVRSPEEINDSRETAPSKRLEKLHPGYASQKPRLGPLIAERIGIDAIRHHCKHFDAWVKRLEQLETV